MKLSAAAVSLGEILPWREKFRQEMQCQIVHDSLHAREGWTESYQLKVGQTIAGYGAILIGGPWKGPKTVFEFYVAPEHRSLAANLFEVLGATAAITAFVVQTNDVLLTQMLRPWSARATCEKIVFSDQRTTSLPGNGASLRRATPDDTARIFPHQVEPVGDWLLEMDGVIVATGGVLYHYNRPYGDIYMEVAAPFRHRGLGSYLVQELKRICREGGNVPCARCQKAGFVPYAQILAGSFSSAEKRSP
jgi:GNAT superfamily N-acetyltransferase